MHYWEGGKGRRYPWSVPWQLGGGEGITVAGPSRWECGHTAGKGKAYGGGAP